MFCRDGGRLTPGLTEKLSPWAWVLTNDGYFCTGKSGQVQGVKDIVLVGVNYPSTVLRYQELP